MARKKQSHYLYERIAGQLEEEIQKGTYPTGTTLPSMRDLAEKYTTSYVTLWKAVHLLADRGLLDVSNGKTCLVLSTGTRAAHMREVVRKTLANQCAETLANEICTGSYKVGTDLPKVDFLAIDKGVSSHTILKACKILKSRNLIHKKGKSWIIGPAAPVSRATSRTFSGRKGTPSVLTIGGKYNAVAWHYSSATIFRGFVDAFYQEITHSNTALKFAFATPQKIPGTLTGVEKTLQYA